MPRTAAHTIDELTHRALTQFWAHGFNATSMDDLIKATGVSRQGIYAAFGGKRDLFLACFDQYQDFVVSPAFASVEEPSATLNDVAEYFEHHIARGEAAGLPGRGCFVANSATEVAPTDAEVLLKVRRHEDRLFRGFANAVRNTAKGILMAEAEVLSTADAIAVFANGLWVVSRTVEDAEGLRAAVRVFISALERKMR